MPRIMFLRICLSSVTKETKNLNGSNMLLMHDNTTLPVNYGFSPVMTSKKKVSISKFQNKPKLR